MAEYNYSDEKLERSFATVEELDEALKADEEAYAEFVTLSESAKYIINTKKPGDIIIKQQKFQKILQ